MEEMEKTEGIGGNCGEMEEKRGGGMGGNGGKLGKHQA